MPLDPIKGFPLSDNYATTRVPNAILGRVLANVEEPDVVKLVLRTVWHLDRQRGYPKFITREDLRTDRVLSRILTDDTRFERALQGALSCNVLIEVVIDQRTYLMLNTATAARAAVGTTASRDARDHDENGWGTPATVGSQSDAFRAYEENIGILTPMIRENILAALEDFTDEDITHAVRIAVENESRSWSFVAGVLRRWSKEGIPNDRRDGKSGAESERSRVPETELRKYLDEQRKRSRPRRS